MHDPVEEVEIAVYATAPYARSEDIVDNGAEIKSYCSQDPECLDC